MKDKVNAIPLIGEIIKEELNKARQDNSMAC